MSETAPSPSRQSPVEQQAQLFNPDLLQAEQARRENATQAINDLEAGDPALANTPRIIESKDSGDNGHKKPREFSVETYKDALDLISKGELPQDLMLKRDWSDTLSQHDEKRAQHQTKLVEALTNKVETLEREKTISERHRIDKVRKENHNRKIEAREKENSERQATKDEYLARQKLLHGEFKLSQDPALLAQVEKDADDHVNKVHGAAKHQDYGVYDSGKQKKPENNGDEASGEQNESEADEPSQLDTHDKAEDETQDHEEEATHVDDHEPETAETKELSVPEKFDHSQAFLPWALKNRVPGIGKLIKERKLGKAAVASVATMVDYAGTNITKSNHYDRYMSKAEKDAGASRKEVKEPEQADSDTNDTKDSDNETKSTEEGVLSNVEHFSDLLKDPTYVPTVDEYEDIVDLADRIKIIHATDLPNGYQEHGIKYIVEDEQSDDQQINAHAARKIIDASNEDGWELSDDSIDQLDAALKLSVESRLLALQQNRKRENKSDFLNYESFVKTRNSIDNTEDVDLLESYHDYLQRRIELIEWFDSLETNS